MLRAANEDGKFALGMVVAMMGYCTLPIPITVVLPAASLVGSGEDF